MEKQVIFQTIKPWSSSTLPKTVKWFWMYYTSGTRSPEMNHIFQEPSTTYAALYLLIYLP